MTTGFEDDDALRVRIAEAAAILQPDAKASWLVKLDSNFSKNVSSAQKTEWEATLDGVTLGTVSRGGANHFYVVVATATLAAQVAELRGIEAVMLLPKGWFTTLSCIVQRWLRLVMQR